MADIQKLDKTFVNDKVLDASELNQITGKVDEIITEVNKQGDILGKTSELLDDLNGEVI